MKEKIKFGQTSLEIVPLIFGGNVFGWTLDQNSSFSMLDRFFDLGFNAIDTANTYSHWVPGNSGGESETIIGNWIQRYGGREKMVLMTKAGGRMATDGKPNSTAAHIKEQVVLSLKRLQTDYIDLYQLHYDDEVTAVEETLRAFEDLVKEGKVRYIGASNISPERLVESLDTAQEKALAPYVSLQPEYNLFDRAKYENLYQPITLEKQIAVIPYYALASGFLSGKYKSEDDFQLSARGADVKNRYWNSRGQAILEALQQVSSQYEVSTAAVALAWLLTHKEVAAPIASATKEGHLHAFVEALQLRLDATSLSLLNNASKY
ncbi:aldo/keto reductase [Sphingobacterium sp. Mn56C]|uniref:aldo/keto reductase n=1 Tax=Sphingobacterium sp. Mn56C TaxID=3395261 RepID=UPI003BD9661B